MGNTYSVASVIYEQASSVVAGCYDEIKIYVGASSDSLFTDTNLAAHYKMAEIASAPIEIGLKKVYTGRYVGFVVYSEQSDYGVLVSELAVFEAEEIDLSGNLLAGKTPKSVSTSSCTADAEGTRADMTDGVLYANSGAYWKCTDWGGACSATLTYDLGEIKSMDSFLYEHGNGGASDGGYDEIKIYVSDSESTLFNANNLLVHYKEAEKGSALPISIPLGYSVSGQYVGFVVYAEKTDYGVKIGELAAFASKDVNLIGGKTAAIMNGTSLQGDIAHLTDGIIASGNVASVDTGVDNNGQSEFVFELDNMTTLEKVFIASVAGETKYYLYAGDVYVSDSIDDLWNKDNVALSFNYGYNSAERCYTYDLEQPVTGKYVGFSFPFDSTNNEWWYRARVAELGVYGTEHVQVNNGAQVRNPAATDNYALRFSFDVYNTGVAYVSENPKESSDYTGDLTNAYIKLAGESYKLKAMGAIVSNTGEFGEALTKEDIDNGSTVDVPAVNLYNVAEGVVTYTAVVKNIPAAYADTPLYAASYVTYETAEGDVTVYGDVISRTVGGVLSEVNA